MDYDNLGRPVAYVNADPLQEGYKAHPLMHDMELSEYQNGLQKKGINKERALGIASAVGTGVMEGFNNITNALNGADISQYDAARNAAIGKIGANSYDELMAEQASQGLLGAVTAKDLGAKSIKDMALNSFKSAASGAMSGMSAGPWGMLAGAATNQITSLIGSGLGNRRLQRQADAITKNNALANITRQNNLNTRAENIGINNANLAMANYNAFGGNITTNGGDFSSGLRYFDAGGSHESNPYEGVQIGVDPQGTPNLVEEGETMFGNYVFSNRIKVNKDIKKAFKLGGSVNTFADASKYLNKETTEMPNDPIAKRTQKKMLERLQGEQEAIKQEMQQAEQMAQMQAMAEAGIDPMQAMQQQQMPPEEQMMMQQQLDPQALLGQQEFAFGGNIFKRGGKKSTGTTYSAAAMWKNANQENFRRAYATLKRLGATDIQAIGVLANMMQESNGYNIGQKGGPAFGYYQMEKPVRDDYDKWRGEREDSIENATEYVYTKSLKEATPQDRFDQGLRANKGNYERTKVTHPTAYSMIQKPVYKGYTHKKLMDLWNSEDLTLEDATRTFLATAERAGIPAFDRRVANAKFLYDVLVPKPAPEYMANAPKYMEEYDIAQQAALNQEVENSMNRMSNMAPWNQNYPSTTFTEIPLKPSPPQDYSKSIFNDNIYAFGGPLEGIDPDTPPEATQTAAPQFAWQNDAALTSNEEFPEFEYPEYYSEHTNPWLNQYAKMFEINTENPTFDDMLVGSLYSHEIGNLKGWDPKTKSFEPYRVSKDYSDTLTIGAGLKEPTAKEIKRGLNKSMTLINNYVKGGQRMPLPVHNDIMYDMAREKTSTAKRVFDKKMGAGSFDKLPVIARILLSELQYQGYTAERGLTGGDNSLYKALYTMNPQALLAAREEADLNDTYTSKFRMKERRDMLTYLSALASAKLDYDNRKLAHTGHKFFLDSMANTKELAPPELAFMDMSGLQPLEVTPYKKGKNKFSGIAGNSTVGSYYKGQGDGVFKDGGNKATWLRGLTPIFDTASIVMAAQEPNLRNVNALIGEAERAGNYNTVDADPIDNYLQYNPLDRNYYLEQLNQKAGATRNAIINASNGNRASAVAGLLAAGYNDQMAVGNLARQAEEYNQAQREKVEAFNRGTNQYNSEAMLRASASNQSARQAANNARLQGMTTAYGMREQIDSARLQAIADSISNFGQNLYNIGTENLHYNMSRLPGDRYSSNKKGKIKYKGR